jgi:hypothetical protein
MNNHFKENSERNTICHRKEPSVPKRNLHSREETSCDRMRPPITVRNLISQEETSCNTKKHLKIDIQMDEHNAEEKIEIAGNGPLLQNAYKFCKNAMNPYSKENSKNGDWDFVRKQAGLIINKSSRVIDRLLKERCTFGFMDK